MPQNEPRSFDSQDINNLKENPDYKDPDDESTLADVEKEILELAEIEANRFKDDDEEVVTSTTMSLPSELSTSVTAPIEISVNNDDEEEESVYTQVPLEEIDAEEKPSKKKYPVTPPTGKILTSQEEYRQQQNLLPQVQEVATTELVASTSKITKKMPGILKRKAEEVKSPEAAGPSEPRAKKKKKVSMDVPATPPRSEVTARQTRANKRKTLGDSPVPEKKAKRKTSD